VSRKEKKTEEKTLKMKHVKLNVPSSLSKYQKNQQNHKTHTQTNIYGYERLLFEMKVQNPVFERVVNVDHFFFVDLRSAIILIWKKYKLFV